MEPFIGEVIMFAGNFAPRSWAFCDGQLLPIASNQALFSILGTTYGGDGRTTFGLPDLRGRVPAGPRSGPGLQTIAPGEKIGTNTNTLTVNELPSHNHPLNANGTASGRSTVASPANNFSAQNSDASGNYATTADGTMNAQAIGATGGNRPVNNMQPTIGINYIICTEGIYPSRS